MEKVIKINSVKEYVDKLSPEQKETWKELIEECSSEEQKLKKELAEIQLMQCIWELRMENFSGLLGILVSETNAAEKTEQQQAERINEGDEDGAPEEPSPLPEYLKYTQ